ncbi:MAG TPA: ThuA domain-containing protein [Luteimonas sp.]|nr:ThuA domain-containing protein [Luteimonas sp.]
MLVFTRTQGFRHDSIPAAVTALRELGAGLGWQIDHSEDAAAFSAENLSRYRVVAFANTTGDVLGNAQQAALRAFVENGGGFVGLHSAADTEYGWPWYGELVGAWFASHPPGLQTTKVVFEGARPLRSTPWRITDELYNYRSNPRGRVRVVATVDERGYTGGTRGEDHPIAWCHRVREGRSWYTGLGHSQAKYGDATFRAHVLRGLRFAARSSEDC